MGKRRGQNEGTIIHRSDGRWEARLSVQGRQRTVAYTRTRDEARQKLTAALGDQDRGVPSIKASRTLGDYAASWLETVERTRKPGTVKRYHELLSVHILPELGRYRLGKITPEMIERLYARVQARGLSSSTAHRVHNVLHKLLKDAQRVGLVAVNVADNVTPPRDATHEMACWTPEQAQTFLDTASGHRLEALFVLALHTGMRLGEILALRWTDVDLKARTIAIRQSVQRRKGGQWEWGTPKTKSGRRLIPVSATVVAALSAHHKRQSAERLTAWPLWQDNKLVFCNEIGVPLSADHVRKTNFYALEKQAGVPHIRFHDLRHTAASLTLLKGVPVKIVSHMLGHSTTVITQDLYQHALPEAQRQAADALESVLARQPVGRHGQAGEAF